MSVQRRSMFQPSDRVPSDANFELTRLYRADQSPHKINLGQGVYRDGDGQPWVLPCLQLAKKSMGSFDHEYQPVAGFKPFVEAAVRLLFQDTTAFTEERIASCQAISGTGALLLAGLTPRKVNNFVDTIYITDPDWPNHDKLFKNIGFTVEKIPYYKAGAFDFETFTETLRSAKPNSAVVLHACAHNPTGCDPSMSQWEVIASIIVERGLFPIFDAAYLGFNSGSFDDDARVIRYFVNEVKTEATVCMSFAKNMGLYGERVGLVSIIAESAEACAVGQSVLEDMQRATVSTPPAYGARVAATVLETPAFRNQWMEDMGTMALRIRSMRRRLFEELQKLQTPGEWSHIFKQSGMFAYLGLSKTQVKHLRENSHVYMAASSRISVAGLNESNVERFARAIDEAIRAAE